MDIKDIIGEEVYNTLSEDKKKELKGKDFEDVSGGAYIPKSRFDEVNEAKKTAEGQVKTLTKDLETAKANAGDNEELKKQLDDAIQKQKDDKKAFDDQMKELKISNAIKLSIADTAQDADLVAGLIDKSKLILGDDGKVTGLDEQIKTLKKDKAFLFKEEKPEGTDPKPQPQAGFFFGNPSPNPGGKEPGQRMSMKDAIAAKLQSQMGQQ